MSSTHELNVALIGTGFMGRTHSQAWHTAPRFFDLPLRPRAAVIVGTDPARTAAAAEKLGWESASTDWRAGGTSSTSAPPATHTPRSRSRRSPPGST
jgi:ornithine cyclodeaminase/alanine dehydrogenase-like protein (mu-crystallin family)